jgi:hypothetical protein
MLSQETVSESLERQFDENWSVALDALAARGFSLIFRLLG